MARFIATEILAQLRFDLSLATDGSLPANRLRGLLAGIRALLRLDIGRVSRRSKTRLQRVGRSLGLHRLSG
jgi:hypothetical protein